MMLWCGVRTTIRLDDELFRQVKLVAARSGRTIGAVVEDAIRLALARRQSEVEPLAPLPTFGAGGPLPGVDLSDNAGLRAAMDGGDLDARR
jgi:hypothetical protein